MPGADRIVVEKEHLGDRFAVQPIVEQQQGIGPPRQSVSHRPISGQFNQVATRFGVKEAGADHAMTTIAPELIRKRQIRVLKESGLYWPKLHYLWRQHPIMEWLGDRILTHFGRHRAPPAKLQPPPRRAGLPSDEP